VFQHWEEQHDREIADIRAVTASTGAELLRGIRLSVEEQQRERASMSGS
jgi:hypothetical protein